MPSEIEIATPPNDISPPDSTPVIEIAPTLDDITQPDPTPVTEESPKYFFAHIVRISTLKHVVNLFMRKFLVTKLDRINGNKINTNTTFLLPEVVQIGQDPLPEGGGLKINTFADSNWKGNAGILFNEDCHFLGFYSADIGSGGFDGFDSNGNIEPQIMTNLELWARHNFHKSRHNNAMKRTPNGTIDKLKEIALRRVGLPADDHSSTQYQDTRGAMIYTGEKDKFHKDHFDGWSQIPKDRLRHNETHIRANISDINGFFVTKSDWESNSYAAINSLKNLYLATKKKRLLAKDDTKALQTFVDLIKDRVKYYNKSIELITAEKSLFEKCLVELEADQRIENKSLDLAFKRKKLKHKEFDSDNEENKKIWLKKHIEKMGIDLQYLRAMIEHSNGEATPEKIKEKLSKEQKICIYDSSKGILREINEEAMMEHWKNTSKMPLLLDILRKVALLTCTISCYAACTSLLLPLLGPESNAAQIGFSLGMFAASTIVAFALERVVYACFEVITQLQQRLNRIHPQVQQAPQVQQTPQVQQALQVQQAPPQVQQAHQNVAVDQLSVGDSQVSNVSSKHTIINVEPSVDEGVQSQRATLVSQAPQNVAVNQLSAEGSQVSSNVLSTKHTIINVVPYVKGGVQSPRATLVSPVLPPISRA